MKYVFTTIERCASYTYEFPHRTVYGALYRTWLLRNRPFRNRPSRIRKGNDQSLWNRNLQPIKNFKEL